MIACMAVIGFFISVYSFMHNQAWVSGNFCTLSSTVNCDIVNRGPYSSIFGIPVSLLGVIGYFLMAVGAFMKVSHPEDRGLTLFTAIVVTCGFVFSLYLTALEFFVINAWCILCIASQLLMLINFILIFSLWKRETEETAI